VDAAIFWKVPSPFPGSTVTTIAAGLPPNNWSTRSRFPSRFMSATARFDPTTSEKFPDAVVSTPTGS
jgi:hypothetical protein